MNTALSCRGCGAVLKGACGMCPVFTCGGLRGALRLCFASSPLTNLAHTFAFHRSLGGQMVAEGRTVSPRAQLTRHLGSWRYVLHLGSWRSVLRSWACVRDALPVTGRNRLSVMTMRDQEKHIFYSITATRRDAKKIGALRAPGDGGPLDV